MIKTMFKKFLSKIIAPFRLLRSYNLKKKLTNGRFSIISNNCTAGIVYNIFSTQFFSPTINLYIKDDDFLFFVNNLKQALNAPLNYYGCSASGNPLGYITVNDRKIVIDFVHYDVFDEAKKKWVERSKRVDYENIYIIWMINKDLTEKKISDFIKIKYDKKMLITYKEIDNLKNAYFLEIFNKKNYKNGEVFWYKHWFSLKRNIELIDFVSFLNNYEH